MRGGLVGGKENVEAGADAWLCELVVDSEAIVAVQQ
jgi:hypothetical protein